MFSKMGCKYIGIRKSEFVAKTQDLRLDPSDNKEDDL